MAMGDVPEQVYLDAAKAHVEALFSHRPLLSDASLKQSKRPGFRAAVASAYRASRRAVAAELREVIESQSSWLWFELGERALEQVAQRIERDTQPGPAATPDGPRRWALPDEPGPEVTAVRACLGTVFERDGDGWRAVGYRNPAWTWRDLLMHAPLADATPAADGQDGGGRG